MPTLSKLSDQCKKCPHVDKCDNKRMVAYALVEMPKPTLKDVTMPVTVPVTKPFAKKHTSITINMGNCRNVNTSMEQITEQLKKDFYKGIFNINCNFNKS